MYLKRRYNKAFTIFIIFQFIVVIFLVYFPMDSHFNEFRNFYLQTQREIFEKIFNKKKADLKQKVVESAIWDELYNQINIQDDEWLNAKFDNMDQSLYGIDSVILIDDKKNIIFSNTKNFPLNPDFLQSNFIDQALNDVIYQSGLIRKGDRLYLIAVSPVVKSTARFNPNGVLIFIQVFDYYFINENIATFMDSDDLTINIAYEPVEQMNPDETIIDLKSIDNQFLGQVILKYNNLFPKGAKELFFQNVLLSLIVLFVLFIFLSQLLSRKLAQRIELLHSEVETAVQRNFNYEIKVQGDDEISGLADSFNKMSQTMRDHVKQILRANEKLNSTYLEIIHGLITAIELKDPYARGHSQRVMIYSELIAKKIKYPDIETIRMAALLHDIGKIGIPEHILNKPDLLTPEEYDIVKAHPDYGYKILSNIEGFNRIKNIIRFHHERVDGKGYPAGMKDIIIPLESRIIAVADTFDAITSDRAYRKGMTSKEAIAELQRVKGTQLDEKIVDYFISIIYENDHFSDLIQRDNALPQIEDLINFNTGS